MSRILDLSYPLSPEMVVWPGNRRPVYEWLERLETGAANVTYMSLCVHTGTHVDSPLHFSTEGVTIDRLPLDHFWGQARLFVLPNRYENYEIPKSAVSETDFEFGDATIFILSTGIEACAEKQDYNLRFPYPSIELLEWLLEQGMRCYMTDATSIDPYGDPISSRHRYLFSQGCPIVENLRNLNYLPINKSFTLCAMPLALSGREGSPCRAAAWLED